jgi:hypothetical protein
VNIVAAERRLFDGFGAAPVFFCAMTLRFANAGRLQGYSAAIGADDGRGFRGQLARTVFFLRHKGFSVFYCFLFCTVFWHVSQRESSVQDFICHIKADGVNFFFLKKRQGGHAGG